MQIKSAVLLAVLSASAASAIKMEFYTGAHCQGAKVGDDHIVFEHSHKYDIPWGVRWMRVSDNFNQDYIWAYNEGACKDSTPEPPQAIAKIFSGCMDAGGVELRCYTITNFKP
ncbi:hypothetical protein BD779DRAFT_1808273 [Infundibulicybe gibba]|nr:hypothetical protein BD779DRAFT_1808273 [Infundibulicybe gibba]